MHSERRYDIDWLRVISIGLLLIYHIAIFFQPWANFIGFIRSEQYHDGLWKFMSMINVWRIPILFYVSGMGVYFAIQNRNVGQLLGDRAVRILLPYVFGILAIVPLHNFIYQKFYGLELSYFAHPGHLWFLGNIIIYISLLFPLFFYLVRNPENRFRKGLIKIMGKPFGPLLLIPFFAAEVWLIKPSVFALYSQTAHGYGIGFLAFLFGFLLVYTGATFWKSILKARYYYLGAAIAFYILRLLIFNAEAPHALMAIESNLWVFGIFGICYRHLNHNSRVLSYLSKAAYPVYIIHMFVSFGVAQVIFLTALPLLVQFALIVLFTFIICLGIYELLLKRIPLLQALFGMGFKFKKPALLKAAKS